MAKTRGPTRDNSGVSDCGPGGGHVDHVPGDQAGVPAPAEGDLLGPGVGRHLAGQHHAAVQGHGVQDLGAGLTRGRICGRREINGDAIHSPSLNMKARHSRVNCILNVALKCKLFQM